jgi:hypothetical protein
MTNKKIIVILNKKLEAEPYKKIDPVNKKKKNIHRNYSAFNNVVNKIDMITDSAPLKERVCQVVSNFKKNIDNGESIWLDIVKKQEESFLNKLYEKKFKKKV